MYCYIKYIEITKHEETESTAISIVSPRHSSDMHSSPPPTTTSTNKLIVNPNCPVPILLDYICIEIGLDKNSNFDLCDLETGEIVGIKQVKPWMYATSVLKSKQTYAVIFFEKNEFGQFTKLEPLLHRHSRQYSEILQKLNKQLNVLKRQSRSSRSRHGSASSKGSTADITKDFTRRKLSSKHSGQRN